MPVWTPASHWLTESRLYQTGQFCSWKFMIPCHISKRIKCPSQHSLPWLSWKSWGKEQLPVFFWTLQKQGGKKPNSKVILINVFSDVPLPPRRKLGKRVWGLCRCPRWEERKAPCALGKGKMEAPSTSWWNLGAIVSMALLSQPLTWLYMDNFTFFSIFYIWSSKPKPISNHVSFTSQASEIGVGCPNIRCLFIINLEFACCLEPLLLCDDFLCVETGCDSKSTFLIQRDATPALPHKCYHPQVHPWLKINFIYLFIIY